MKRYLKIVTIIICLMSIQGIAQNKSQVEVEYDFPSFMTEHNKTFYLKEAQKGKILYDLSCAKCHNFKVKRKEFIPDFSSENLQSYELRTANARHEGNMTEAHVTTEELGYIITFFSYKKKNPPTIVAPVAKK